MTSKGQKGALQSEATGSKILGLVLNGSLKFFIGGPGLFGLLPTRPHFSSPLGTRVARTAVHLLEIPDRQQTPKFPSRRRIGQNGLAQPHFPVFDRRRSWCPSNIRFNEMCESEPHRRNDVNELSTERIHEEIHVSRLSGLSWADLRVWKGASSVP